MVPTCARKMIESSLKQQQQQQQQLQLQQFDQIDYIVTTLYVDSSFNTYVGGYLYDTTTGTYKTFIRKFDNSNPPNTIWETQFGTSGDDYIFSLEVDSDLNIYVAGCTNGSFPGFTNAGYGYDSYDVFVMKIDQNSNPPNTIWTMQFGTSDDDDIDALVIDISSNVYVAGDTSGSFPGFTNAGGADPFVMKIDQNTNPPNIIWTSQFGTSGNDYIKSLAIDSNLNIYVAGCTNGSFPGFTNAGYGYSYDAFVMKIDQHSNPPNTIWTKQFGTIGNDYINSLAVDSSFILYLGGTTSGSFPNFTNAGYGNDAFIVKLDSSTPPNTTWIKQLGTSEDDYLSSLVIDMYSQVYVGGYTSGSFPGFTNAGYGNDAFVMKIDNSISNPPNIIWTTQFGTSRNDEVSALVVDINENVYIGGSTSGSFPGFTIANEGYIYDGFIRKLEPNSNPPKTVWTTQFGSSTAPTVSPTAHPTHNPSAHPTIHPTPVPSAHPTTRPTPVPSARPTRSPTPLPSYSSNPTPMPSPEPSIAPNPYPEILLWSNTPCPATGRIVWHCITSDSQGVNLVAGGEGTIKYSRDGGKSWIVSLGDYYKYSSNYASIASSASGQFVVVGSSDEKLWISINYGQSFSLGATYNFYDQSITDVAISSDGSSIIAMVNGLGVLLYTLDPESGEVTQVGTLYTFDSGNTNYASCITTDTSFQKLILGTNTFIYYSSNGGSTWLQSNAPSMSWGSITCSANGQYLAAVAGSQKSLYYSKDSGATWLQSSTPTRSLEVRSISSSSSGMLMAAAVYNSPIYLSCNFGQSWYASRSTSANWYAVSFGAQGGYLFSADNGGNGIFKSSILSLQTPTLKPTFQASSAATPTQPLPLAIAGLVISVLLLLCGAAYVVYLKRTSIYLFFKPESSLEMAIELDQATNGKGRRNNRMSKVDLKGVAMNSIMPGISPI